MQYTVDNQTLILYFVGELNSFNAEDVEKEIEQIVAKSAFNAIQIDMNELSYISSAGLRIIARLKQHYDDTSLINVLEEVNEIFEMVGFNNIVHIEKKAA